MKIVFKNFTLLSDDESRDVLELRNQKQIRENMINSDEILLNEHKNFVETLKNSKNREYFAIIIENSIVGSVNYLKKQNISWGLYFADDVSPIVKSIVCYRFLDYIFSKFDEEIESFVKVTNTNAYEFNKNFGFRIFDENKEYLFLRLSKSVWQEQKEKRILKSIKKFIEKTEFIFEDKR